MNQIKSNINDRMLVVVREEMWLLPLRDRDRSRSCASGKNGNEGSNAESRPMREAKKRGKNGGGGGVDIRGQYHRDIVAFGGEEDMQYLRLYGQTV
ncbi:hypothetical protein PDE_04794 [Penicillium oxalicum 114-2]|uniref:Uncharacterized protein n=1 Tax=Penicillium oxalicum (strain 114-2 / CGMCC 5302) TaxID=933388 RepID=S7ZHX3_PENO1|nr:hypothetical protein PDE_04794 [Penicillium oxalicum 114-2]